MCIRTTPTLATRRRGRCQSPGSSRPADVVDDRRARIARARRATPDLGGVDRDRHARPDEARALDRPGPPGRPPRLQGRSPSPPPVGSTRRRCRSGRPLRATSRSALVDGVRGKASARLTAVGEAVRGDVDDPHDPRTRAIDDHPVPGHPAHHAQIPRSWLGAIEKTKSTGSLVGALDRPGKSARPDSRSRPMANSGQGGRDRFEC